MKIKILKTVDITFPTLNETQIDQICDECIFSGACEECVFYDLDIYNDVTQALNNSVYKNND